MAWQNSRSIGATNISFSKIYNTVSMSGVHEPGIPISISSFRSAAVSENSSLRRGGITAEEDNKFNGGFSITSNIIIDSAEGPAFPGTGDTWPTDNSIGKGWVADTTGNYDYVSTTWQPGSTDNNDSGNDSSYAFMYIDNSARASIKIEWKKSGERGYDQLYIKHIDNTSNESSAGTNGSHWRNVQKSGTNISNWVAFQPAFTSFPADDIDVESTGSFNISSRFIIIYYSKDTSVKAGDDRSWIKFTGNDTGLVPNSGVGSTNQLSIKNDFQNRTRGPSPYDITIRSGGSSSITSTNGFPNSIPVRITSTVPIDDSSFTSSDILITSTSLSPSDYTITNFQRTSSTQFDFTLTKNSAVTQDSITLDIYSNRFRSDKGILNLAASGTLLTWFFNPFVPDPFADFVHFNGNIIGTTDTREAYKVLYSPSITRTITNQHIYIGFKAHVSSSTYQNDMCIAAIGLLSGEEEPRYKYLWNFSQVYNSYVSRGSQIPDSLEWFTDTGLAGHHNLTKSTVGYPATLIEVDREGLEIAAPIGRDSINTVPNSDDSTGNDGKFYWSTGTSSSSTGADGGISTVGFDQVGQPPEQTSQVVQLSKAQNGGDILTQVGSTYFVYRETSGSFRLYSGCIMRTATPVVLEKGDVLQIIYHFATSSTGITQLNEVVTGTNPNQTKRSGDMLFYGFKTDEGGGGIDPPKDDPPKFPGEGEIPK